MDAISLPFDIGANGSTDLMFSRPHSISISRISVEFPPGSDYDELSVYAMGTSSYIFSSDYSYTTNFSLFAIGETTSNAIAPGTAIVVYDLEGLLNLEKLKFDYTPYLRPSYPIKLISRYSVLSNTFPYMDIRTDKVSMAPIRTGYHDSQKPGDVAFIYQPLIENIRGSNVDITFPTPIIAHGYAQFSILLTYINKTGINKRCKVTLYSSAIPGNSNLLPGALIPVSLLGPEFRWATSPYSKSSTGTYRQDTLEVCKLGTKYAPVIQSYTIDESFDPYDYWGGVLYRFKEGACIFLVPYNGARKSKWHYIDLRTGLDTPTLRSYTHGIDPSELAPAAAYRGGVLAKNGNIYFCPYAQCSHPSGKWHYLNVTTLAVHSMEAPVLEEAEAGGTVDPDGYSKFPAYCGGVFTMHNNYHYVYLAPYYIAPAYFWHLIDTHLNRVFVYEINGGEPSGIPSFAYRGCVYDMLEGRIYLCPHRRTGSTKWHYINITGNPDTPGQIVSYVNAAKDAILEGTVPYMSMTSPLTLDRESRIYLLPYDQAAGEKWNYIDTYRVVGHSYNKPTGTALKASHWIKPVLTPSGRLFLIPEVDDGDTVWQYINYPKRAADAVDVVTYENETAYVDNYTGAIEYFGLIYLIPAFSRARPVVQYPEMLYIKTNATQDFGLSVSQSPELNHS